MNEYTKVNWQDGTVLQPAKVTIDGTDYNVEPAVESGTTPVNATNLDKMDTALKQAHDGVRDMEVNKINKATIELLTVDSTAPEHCNMGDLYYNTTTNFIYTATATDTWGTTGELPSSKYLYVDLTNSKLYYYDGTTFTSYGGGSSNDVVISPDQPTDSDWKIWIDNTETTDNTYYNDNGTATPFKATTFDTLPVGAEVDYDGETVPTGWTEVVDPNTYSTDEIKIGTWIDGKPLYRKVIQTTIPTSGNNQNVSFQNNVAIMKSVTGFALQSASGGVNLILPYISMSNSWSIYAYYNRANQELVIENSGTSFMNNMTCYLIAEYTKTTD